MQATVVEAHEHWVAGSAEVVLFTAGLEDYAKPILDELDRRYGDVFKYRLYRPATMACPAYPCLKVSAVCAGSP
jgi:RNA polymerase II subunit A small phosphatase-like protein